MHHISTAYTHTMDAARTCFERALAVEARALNEQRMRSSWPPDDVWLLIWKTLPMTCRINVSHVCHSWRALALASPTMWSHLEFESDAHDDECDCDRCRTYHDYGPHCDRCSGKVCAGGTNMTVLRNLIPRTQQVPLSLSISIYYSPPSGDGSYDSVQNDLAKLLSPHLHRFVLLHLNQDDSEGMWFATLLLCFDELPALRHLDMAESSGFLSHISMPALESLNARCGYYDDDDYGPLHFPSVTSVESCSPYRPQYLEELLGVLSMVPNVKTLRVGEIVGADDDEQLEILATLAARIPHVDLSKVDLLSDCIVLAFSAWSGRPYLRVGYSNASEHAGVLAKAGIRIFADLAPDIQLLFSPHGNENDWIAVRGTDTSGRSRELLCPSGAALRIWEHVAAGVVSALTVSLSLWDTAVPAIPVCPALKSLTVVLDGDSELPAAESLTVRFPSIDRLRMRAPVLTSIRAQALASIVGAFAVRRQLAEVILERVRVDGDNAVLEVFAKSVTYLYVPQRV